MNQLLNSLWNLFSYIVILIFKTEFGGFMFTLCVSFLIDPHIKVSGKKEDVKEAKEMIMSVLDTKVSEC